MFYELEVWAELEGLEDLVEAEPLEDLVEKEELEVKEVKEDHLVLKAIVRPSSESGQQPRIGMTPITVSGIVGVAHTKLMTPAPTLLLLLMNCFPRL